MLGLLTTGHSHERKRVLGSLLRQAHTQAHLRLCRDPLLWLPRANTSTSTQCGVAASLQGSLGMMGCKPCDLRRREGDRTTARSAQPSAARAGSVGSPGKPEHPGKDLLSRGPFRFNQDFQGQRPRPLPGNVDPLRSSQREAGPREGPRAPAVL